MDKAKEFDGKWYLKVLVSSSLGLQILLYLVVPWRKRITSRVVLGLISIIFSLSNWIPAVTLMLITSCVVFSNDGGTTGPESPLLTWASLMLLNLAGHEQERRAPLFLQPSENANYEYLKVIIESLFYLVIFLIAFSLHSKSWNNETSPFTLVFMLLACLKTIVKLKRLRKSSVPYEYTIRNNYNNITKSTTPSDACREIEAEIERMYDAYYGGVFPPDAVVMSLVLINTLACISKETNFNIHLPIYITLFVAEYFLEYDAHQIYNRGLYRLPGWSNTIQRFNLLTYSLRKPSKISASIHHILNTWPLSGKEQYTDDVGKFVFSELRDIVFLSSSYDPHSKQNVTEQITAAMGVCDIKQDNRQDLVDCEAPFVERVLLWHVATGILYHTNTTTQEDNQSCFMSMVLSDYMGYLLLVQPWIMSKQRGAVLRRCLQMWAEIYELIKDTDIHEDERICEMIINQQQSSGMDQTKTLLQGAYVLAKKLESTFPKPDHRWSFIARIWVDKLAYAATQCSPIDHIQGLSQGGELATIVWLWILHFETTSESVSSSELREKGSVSDVHSIHETSTSSNLAKKMM